HIGDWPDFMTATFAQREILYMFMYRCRFRRTKHDERGWDDVLSLFRIARHLKRQSSPDSPGLANTFEGRAAFHATNILNAAEFNAAQLRQCLADLDSLPQRTTFEDRLEYTRLGWLKNISEFPQIGPVAFKLLTINVPDKPWFSEDDKKAIRRFNAEINKVIRIYREILFDWNIVAEIMNAEYDDRLGKPTKQTIFQSNPPLRKVYDDTKVPEHSFDEILAVVRDGTLKGMMDKSEGLVDKYWNRNRLKRMSIEARSVYLAKAFFNGYAKGPEYFAYEYRDGTTAFEMTKTEITLRLYKTEQGNYPATLAALVEKGYLSEVPNDPYRETASPLMYRNEDDGPCILYSVGRNGIDDGGRRKTSYSLGDPDVWDDIIVQLK
ncbi:MAG: type II secretion system protein GspG, partial [Planctomycetaceae bacterium]|nr:type II secretion system protein GspG [Planctomycetaceae bacterium]